METIRLDKFLSSQLTLSRTDAKKLIKQNKVTVNGLTQTRAEAQIDVQTDEVCCDGRLIAYKKYIYLMLDKPEGVVSASNDKKERTVIDLVPENLRRPGLFPAGRLDKDTTGFVLITDDGAFAHGMLSPAHHVEKTYIVTLEREVLPDEARQIESGVEVGGEVFRPARLRTMGDGSQPVYEIVLTEGRYHQIKRTFARFGNRVVSLRRIKIGGLPLDCRLQPGECRELSPEELRMITE